MDFGYDYESCVKASEKVSWRLDDVMPLGTRLDFSRKFLPDRLAPDDGLPKSFDENARRVLNHISANAYLNLFAFVEEYILATMLKHAQAEVFGKPEALRALSRFVDEELKHQLLFHRYREAFDRDFGSRCEVLESAVEVAGVIMSHSPIAVLLVTLHIELMTQQHFTECVKDEGSIDPLFKSLLRNHWLEESQHAKIDALELGKLTSVATPERLAKGFDEYLGILQAFDGLLAQQADMDVKSLAAALGRDLGGDEQRAVVATQLAGYRRTFIWYGMTNPTFCEIISEISPEKAASVKEQSPKYGASQHVS